MIYRVMIPDTFVNVEADNLKEAEKKVADHIKAHPPGTSESLIWFSSWPVEDEDETDI